MTLSLPLHMILAAGPALAAPARAPAPSAVPADPDVRIEPPAGTVHEGEAVGFTVREAADGPILIDGCAPVEIERKNGAAWLPVPGHTCDTPVPATTVDGTLTFSVAAPSVGAYRAVLTWGMGCTPGFPLATANCARLGSVVSDPLIVAPAPPK